MSQCYSPPYYSPLTPRTRLLRACADLRMPVEVVARARRACHAMVRAGCPLHGVRGCTGCEAARGARLAGYASACEELRTHRGSRRA